MKKSADRDTQQPHQLSLGDVREALQPQVVPLHELVAEILSTLAEDLGSHRVASDVSVPSTLCVFADRKLLRTAVESLVHRACTSMPRGGQLVITAVVSSGSVELEVADTGFAQGFEQHYRALRIHPLPAHDLKDDLAVAQRIAAAHGGRVSACNCPEGGSAITLHLPAPATRAAA